MPSTEQINRAKAAFSTFCECLDDHQWHYQKDEENLKINCGAQGDDLPMDINISADVERQLIFLFSKMPFTISEDKRLDIAIAVSSINNCIIDGHFDFNIQTGEIYFRMVNTFIDSQVSKELCAFMLFCSCGTIDDYNDKLLMIDKGMLPLDKFLQDLMS